MNQRLGIIDWGIGGIGIYKLIKRKRSVPITYFSDTGVMPYGKMSRDELIHRLDVVIQYLKRRGTTHLVVGCNAASTGIDSLSDHGIPIVGVINAAVQMSARLSPTRMGLIGGRRTVVSGVYRKAFGKLGIELHQRVAQPLSALIETGDVSSPGLRMEAARILHPLRNCSHILLACTHYPAILNVLQECVSPTTKLIDPGPELIRAVEEWNIESGGEDEFLTTGDASAMKHAALAAFGVKLLSARKVTV